MMAGTPSSPPCILKEDFVKSKRSSAQQDLLSSLPDLLICHIFSFLPIKDIVRTSILSRYWQFKWKLTRAVSFTCPDYFYDFNFDSFRPWFDKVLVSLTTSTLQKFHLHNYPYHRYTSDAVELWTRFAVLRHAEDVAISLHSYRDSLLRINVGHYSLPKTLFGCQSLVNLQVSYCDFYFLNDDSCIVNWSSLKLLQIEEGKIDDQAIDKVLKGSPMLEYLELNDCCGMKHIQICSKKMRELVVDGYVVRDYWDDEEFEFETEDDDDIDDDDPTLEISAPHLHSLRILGFWEGKRVIKLNDVSSLVKAELDFHLRSAESYDDVVCDMMEELLDQLGHIRELIIGNLSLQDLHFIQMKAKLSALPKCQYLTLNTGCNEQELPGIVEMLKLTPNLEHLVMKLAYIELYQSHWKLHDKIVFNEEDFWISQGDGLNGVGNHLKTVEISGFRADLQPETKYWLSFIKFLLRSSLVLENMVINVLVPVTRVDQQKSVGVAPVYELPEVAQQILDYERGSKASKVCLNVLPHGVNPI